MDIKLRLFREDDFDAFHAIVSDYDVVKMTSSWPYPAEEEFTRMRMNTPEAQAGQVKAIEVDGELAGSIGVVDGGVGYMIGRAFWGRGVMTNVLTTEITHAFNNTDVEEIKACVWHDNPASARVLEKNGFLRTKECSDFCKARDAEVKAIHYELSRADWEKRGQDT